MRHLAARADRGQDDRRKNQDEKREVVPRAARPGGHPAARRRSRTAAAIETVPAAGGLAGSTAVPVRAAGSPSSRQGHRAPGGGQLSDPWRAIRGGGTPRGTNARWRRAGARCGARWPPRFRGLFHPHPNGQRPESGRHADQGGVQPSVRGPALPGAQIHVFMVVASGSVGRRMRWARSPGVGAMAPSRRLALRVTTKPAVPSSRPKDRSCSRSWPGVSGW